MAGGPPSVDPDLVSTLDRLDVHPTDDPTRWEISVGRANISGLNTLFGGAALGAAVGAAEAVAGRDLVWCTGQFISQAHPGETVAVDVDVRAEGRAMTQVVVRCHVDDRTVLDVMAALGRRSHEAEATFAVMPDVPAPEDCRPQPSRHDRPTLSSAWDRRLAAGREFDQPITRDDGRSALWLSPTHGGDVDAALLAVLGDFVPFGVHQFVAGDLHMSSLDNTVRIVNRATTDWILADVEVHSVRNGIGQGHVHLWSREGQLLATASQSCQIRINRG